MYNTEFHAPRVFADLVERAVKSLKGVKFDTVVFRGFSGAIVGPVVALRLGKAWALVRKAGDNAHSSRRVEGRVDGDYIIIDDFIDSGETVREIVYACDDGQCVGAYFYDYRWSNARNDPNLRAGLKDRIGGIKILNWE